MNSMVDLERIPQYTIVCSEELLHVVNRVNTLLKDNWKLYGTLVICPSTYEKYAQALVKNYEKNTTV